MYQSLNSELKETMQKLIKTVQSMHAKEEPSRNSFAMSLQNFQLKPEIPGNKISNSENVSPRNGEKDGPNKKPSFNTERLVYIPKIDEEN